MAHQLEKLTNPSLRVKEAVVQRQRKLNENNPAGSNPSDARFEQRQWQYEGRFIV